MHGGPSFFIRWSSDDATRLTGRTATKLQHYQSYVTPTCT